MEDLTDEHDKRAPPLRTAGEEPVARTLTAAAQRQQAVLHNPPVICGRPSACRLDPSVRRAGGPGLTVVGRRPYRRWSPPSGGASMPLDSPAHPIEVARAL